jgi:hypothetical protein
MEASACIGVKLHVGVLPVTVMKDRNPTPEEAIEDMRALRNDRF